jgi:hypothetical protein
MGKFIVLIPIFSVLNSRSYTGFEFGILVIGICLLFGICNLCFPIFPGSGYGKTKV